MYIQTHKSELIITATPASSSSDLAILYFTNQTLLEVRWVHVSILHEHGDYACYFIEYSSVMNTS